MCADYAVNYWGSHPDLGNDDCWTGLDFATEAAAEEAFTKPPRKPLVRCQGTTSHGTAKQHMSSLTGRGCIGCARIPSTSPRKSQTHRKKKWPVRKGCSTASRDTTK